MALLTVACMVLCLSFGSVVGQKTYAPIITPYDFVGKITANTVILRPPLCFFTNLTSLNCTQDTCEIYLVPAIGSGVSTFDEDQNNSSILEISPYPTAFSSPTSKNYYLTRVGSPGNFTCKAIPGLTYFRVGSDGNCSDPNCNGILPTSSNVRFKYVLLHLPNGTVLQQTNWSNTISLVSPKSPDTINDGLGGRSAAMIVITTILSVALFLFLLLLLVALIYLSCSNKLEPMPILGSLRIRKYDTHNLKDPVPYENPSYEGDLKFSTTEVPPKVSIAGGNPELQDSVKLKSYKNYDLPEVDSQTT
ncbi:hypothetical protein AAFF_G00043350 [Aldrovandia affinis]|uniref:Uncharacterized protein n=1 Tax=Aldrovandia affinis TaxID=143900 RepID=A0AAD7S2D3_9TELE|nr:hypothetical protein AAFF_G00043350 [Aldrovandia affinis]